MNDRTDCIAVYDEHDAAWHFRYRIVRLGAFDRGNPPEGQDLTEELSADDIRDFLAPSKRREVADASDPRELRSALHHCLHRHGISCWPDIEGDKPKRQRFRRYPIRFFNLDIAEVQTADGKSYLFVTMDRTSKFAVVQLADKATRRTALDQWPRSSG
ncbi:RNA-directed DNA polymerase [Komagataeibacter europaeus]|nr:RNA-directed DNA polymerase [Komagataeibacter europaeus]